MSSDAMRGGAIWPTMISTCVQNSVAPHHAMYVGGGDGSAGFQPHASAESRSPAPAWHAQTSAAHPTAINNNNNVLAVKQEPMDHDSYREYQDSGISATYTSDDGFISSSSPSRHSEHSSRDSHQAALSASPQSTDSRELPDPMIFYNSTPYNYHNGARGYEYRSPPHHQQTAVAGHSSTLKSSPLHEVDSPLSRKTADSPNLSEGEDSEFNYAKSDDETPIKNEKNATSPTDQAPPSTTDSAKDDYKPSFNSHGKLKTYKCKRCGHVSATKYDSWKHREEHIPKLKQMRCEHCPFVTEYKHYFEYHLRKHEGSKPFKCDKCEYMCENKSMLTSHKKSHSTVYQFRCNDCEYATKYMHSLKQHLRKFTHRPAVVLNEDGTPNQTLIDVYGTRRGPRQRRTPNKVPLSLHQQQQQQLPNTIAAPLPTPDAMQFISSILQDPIALASFLNSSQLPADIVMHLMQNPLLMNGNPQLHLLFSMLNSQRVPQQMEVPQINSENSESGPNCWECRQCGFKADSEESLKVHSDAEHSITDPKIECTSENWECQVCDFKTDDEMSLKIHFGQEHGEPIVDVQVMDENDSPRDDDNAASALDLTNKSDSPTKNVTLNVPTYIRTEVPSILKERRNRRKGRAYKLDTMDQNSSDELEQQAQRKNSVIEHTQDVSKDETTEDASSGVFTCDYCEISFKFIGMYKVHMGYHGFRDPYACNMCGLQCADKMAFYAHTLHERHG